MQRQSEKVARGHTLEAVAREWLALQETPPAHSKQTPLAAVTIAKARWLLDSFLVPEIGARPIGAMTVHPQRQPQEALSALDGEIERLQDERVNQDEITRAIKQARAIFAYGSENITNQAFWMGYAEMFADYNWFLTYLERLSAVTPEDVPRVAQQYMLPRSRVVGTYIPNGGEA